MWYQIKFTALLIVCGIIIAGCGSTEINYPEGGYEYPQSLNNIDTNKYCFPQGIAMPTRDSFRFCYYGKYLRDGYNEPNLAIKPLKKTVFRLIYETAFTEGTIFIITEDEIIVKQSIKDRIPYPIYDSANLNDLEKYHYSILYRSFPIQNPAYSGARKKRLDSLANLFPKLLDPSYYQYLLNKSAAKETEPFAYTTQRKKLTKKAFHKIITAINNAGYWKMSYLNKCDTDFLDGFGFILEANTAKKYNVVRIDCPFDKSAFVKACQDLIDAANLEKPIHIY